MIGAMLSECDTDLSTQGQAALDALAEPDLTKRWRSLARLVTALENESASSEVRTALTQAAATSKVPAIGITGTGGAGKSSLTDELVRRLRLDQGDALSIAVISIDPSRRKSGGALLGDRIRMNAINPWQQGPKVYMRSLATREAGSEISRALPDVIAACKVAGFDLIIVETSGIGQGDAAIVPLVDASLYVMTPEYGAASQLEKIDMLDFADFVAINKFDRKGALDALRDVAKQVQRNRGDFSKRPEEMPVFGTMAARFNDDGVTALFQTMLVRLREAGPRTPASRAARRRHAPLDEPDADRPAESHALSRRDRRHGARLSPSRHRAGPHRPRAPAAHESARMLAAECSEDNPNLLALAADRDAQARRTFAQAHRDVARHAEGLRRRRVRREDPRSGRSARR
jgi:methylmalonyl-CoA mutase